MKLFRSSKVSTTPKGSDFHAVVVTNSGSGVQLTKEDLLGAIRRVEAAVEPWDATRIVLEKPLQDAARNHGQVLLMKDTTEGKLMAVKRMPNKWMRNGHSDFKSSYPTASEQPWQDIGILSQLATVGFPYICEFYGVYRSDKDTFVATSFCEEGDLFGWCDSPGLPPPSLEREDIIKGLGSQIVAGIRWLHDLGVAHRDISLENILLQGKGHEAKVKLIDFGMATFDRMVANELRGKNSYQAPECHIANVPVDTFLADAFAVGVTLFAMSVHDYPWTCTKRGTCQLFEYVTTFGFRRFLEKRRMRRGKGEVLSDVLSEPFVDLIIGLVDFDAAKRTCLGEVCFEAEVARKRRRNACGAEFFRGCFE